MRKVAVDAAPWWATDTAVAARVVAVMPIHVVAAERVALATRATADIVAKAVAAAKAVTRVLHVRHGIIVG